jgi:hypothetical protein
LAKLIIYNSPEEAGIKPRKISAVLIRGSYLSIVVTVEEDDTEEQSADQRGSADSPEES